MAKKASTIPMVTQPVRLSDIHPMAEGVPAKRSTPRSNNTNSNSAKHIRLRRSSLKKQRSLLASEGK
jgi:hypothetical protein